MSGPRNGSHRGNTAGGPEEGLLLGLSEDLLARALLFSSADDACRLKAVCRKLDGSLSKLVCFGQHHRPSQPQGVHWWSCLERRTRGCDEPISLHEVPALAAAFGLDASSGTPQAQQQPQQQQPGAAGDDVAAENESEQEDRSEELSEEEEEPQYRLQVLAAAALFGGWWGPDAEPEAGWGSRRALRLNDDCLGAEAALAVRAMVKGAGCPAAARGFWGTLLLGLLASTTSAAAAGGGARLAQQLLKLAAQAASSSSSSNADESSGSRPNSRSKSSSIRVLWRQIPVPAPDTTPWEEATDPAAAAGGSSTPADGSDSAAAADGGSSSHWLPQGCESSAACLHYHVRQFLSALLVLLRLAPLRRNGLQEAAALQELHYSVLQELLLQEAQEADAAAAALSGMPGQPNSSQLAAAAGLPAGARPTAEQLKVVHAVAAAPGANNDLVLINAFAGTAKSTTLKLLMHANPESVFLYTAFNKVVVEDARSSAPRHVDCKTTHQLAAPKREEMKARPRGWQLWNGGLMVDEIWDALKQLPYYQQRVAAGSKGPPRQVAAAVKEALDKFVTSADRRLGRQHLPKALDPLSDPPDYVEVAQQMWQAIMDSSCRPLKFSHNTYLKQFSDSLVDNQGILRNWRGQRNQIILIDEAQDVNPVTLQMLLSQPCLRVLVGDRHQHIYSFNHCANALEGAAAAAAAAGRPSRVRSYSLSSSFRLGPAVAAVANKLLWQLGERKRPLVGVGRQHAAVYRQVKPDHAQQGTAAAAAAAGQAEGAEGAEAGAEEAYFEQVQLLPQQTTTDHTPAQLESLSLRVDTKDGPKQLHLALPPVDPQTGKRKPLWYVTRYNKAWVEAAAALVLPDRQLAGLGSPASATPGSRLAGTPGTGARNNGGRAAALDAADGSLRRNLFGVPAVAAAAAAARVLEQDREEAEQQQQQQQQQYVVPKLFLTAVDGYSGRVEFLENVLGIYRLKYQGMRFRQYSSWDDLEKAAERREDADLLGAIGLVRKYKQATQQLVDAIKDAQVLRKADADFILGTCHKAKGYEEDYVQLADDFTPIQAGRQPDVEVDEYNLLYVAATRAKLALVLNPDLQQLLLAGSHRPVLLQAAGDAARGEAVEESQAAAQHCSCCEQRMDRPAGTATSSTSSAAQGVAIALVPQQLRLQMPVLFGAEQAEPGLAAGVMQQVQQLEQQWQAMQQQQEKPICAGCVKSSTIWGQLCC